MTRDCKIILTQLCHFVNIKLKNIVFRLTKKIIIDILKKEKEDLWIKFKDFSKKSNGIASSLQH